MADRHAQQELEKFHKTHAKTLQAMASSLQAAGIARVHYGLDFNNDEPDLGEYAIVEYANGRTEEISEWHPMLDHELLMWKFPLGSGAYTFDATTARVLEDAQGGLIDVAEAVSRAYHTPEQREAFEAEAAEFQEEMAAFMDEYNELEGDGADEENPR